VAAPLRDCTLCTELVMRAHAITAACAIVSIASCLHHRDVVPCSRQSSDKECWESSRHDAQGRLRHIVIEQRTPGPRCDTVHIEQDSFDENGRLVERAIDQRTCDVVDLRMVDHYDLYTGQLDREISVDLDHDAQFDRVVHEKLPLTDAQRELVTHRLDEEVRELKAAHAREHREP
jgi:hypothetical protein